MAEISKGLIREKLIHVMARELKVSKSFPLDDSAQIIRDIGLSSLKILNLVVLVEESFGINIDPQDLKMENFYTIGDITALILRNLPAVNDDNEKKIYLEETTLRDGDQTPSVNFFLEEKIDIALMLSDILTEDDTIDAGFPSASLLEMEAVKDISKIITKNYVMALSRMKEADIDVTYEALKYSKKRKIGLIIPSSPIHRSIKLNKSRDELLDMVVKSIKYAQKYFNEVEVGFEDGTRTEMDYILLLVEKIIDAGACSITIADTLGCSTPWEIGKLFHQIKNRVPNIDKLRFLGVHCHNDLGLALANSIEAVRNGANKIGCAFNGLGERAGNTPTEELLMFFKLKPQVVENCNRRKYDYSKIMECSNLIKRYSRIELQKHKPIVGHNCYLHESGIHQDGIIKNKDTYQLFDSSIIGYQGEIFAFGKHSGRSGLKYKLRKLGYDLQSIDIDWFFEEFKKFAERSKDVNDEDIIALVRKTQQRQINAKDMRA